MWKLSGARITNIIQKKKKIGGLACPGFKTYYKAIIVSFWQKSECKDQWNRIENPEKDPCIDGQFIFNNIFKLFQ